VTTCDVREFCDGQVEQHVIQARFLFKGQVKGGSGAMPMEWTPQLSVGVKEIDDQHKELFGQVNSLLDAMSQGKDEEEIGKVARFLEDYIVRHFRAEERYMVRYRYADYAPHAAAHTRFIKDFLNLKNELRTEGPTRRIIVETQIRLCDWLVDHVSKTDSALGAFLKTKLSGNL
jgi:hemerythrin